MDARASLLGSFAVLFCLLAACVDYSEPMLNLEEEWVIPLDGSFHGIRNISSIKMIGNEFVILDAVSGRLHVVTFDGDHKASKRLEVFEGGFLPFLLSPLGDSLLVLASHRGEICKLYNLSLEQIPQECTFPASFLWKYTLDWSPPHLVLFGEKEHSSKAIHVLQWDGHRFGLVRSMGELLPRAEGPDSLLLGHGVGIGTVSEGSIFRTALNPLVLRWWNQEGRIVREIELDPPLEPLDSFVGLGATAEGRLTPLFPRATGMEVWSDTVIVSTYSPSEDISNLWILSASESESAHTSVPFRMTVLERVDDLILFERQLERIELAAYAMRFQ